MLVAVLAHPVLETLLFGQINVVTTTLVIVDLLVVPRGRQGWLVGLATGVKLVSGLFIVYLLITRRFRAAVNATFALIATVAVGFAVAPGQSWSYWTSYMLDPDRVGGIAYVTNQSILGISARLLRNPHPPAGLTLTLSAVVALAALVLAWRRHRRGDELTAICVVAVGSLLASPISWSHHWVWVVPGIAVLVAWAVPARSWWRWSTVASVGLVMWVGPMRFMPKAGLQELHHTLGQQIIANCYGFLAVAFLVWTAVHRHQLTTEPYLAPRPRAPEPAPTVVNRGLGEVPSLSDPLPGSGWSAPRTNDPAGAVWSPSGT
jgi:alpha-1,2-mannosyltransferase